MLIQLSCEFDRLKPDTLLILGDRYEIMATSLCALTMNIRIAHIHGGESTQWAIDEQTRNSITKRLHLHFVNTDTYKNNVLKLEEQKFRVFNVGAPCLKIPVVNIGDRQKGRLRHDNIIDVSYDCEDIVNGIKTALYNSDFKHLVSTMTNKYGSGDMSKI